MKKFLVGICMLLLCVSLVACGGAQGKNVTGIVTSDNMVYFEPKCPECNHVGHTKAVNVSEGEEYEGMHICEKCGELFDIYISR